MFDLKYGVVEEFYQCESGKRRAYGLAVYDATNDWSTVLDAVHDLSDDETQVRALADECNQEELDLDHFQDIIVDFLNR